MGRRRISFFLISLRKTYAYMERKLYASPRCRTSEMDGSDPVLVTVSNEGYQVDWQNPFGDNADYDDYDD